MELSNAIEMGERLAKLRAEKRLTQSQAAEAVGITESQCSKIECGRSSAKLSTAVKFAQLYGVTLDYLLLGRTSEVYSKIICKLDEMSDENVALLYEIIERIEKFKGNGHGE